MTRKTKIAHKDFMWELRVNGKLEIVESLHCIDFMAAREEVDKQVASHIGKGRLVQIPAYVLNAFHARWKPMTNQQTTRVFEWIRDGVRTHIRLQIRQSANPLNVKSFVKDYLLKLGKPCCVENLYRCIRASVGRICRGTVNTILRDLAHEGCIDVRTDTNYVRWTGGTSDAESRESA